MGNKVYKLEQCKINITLNLEVELFELVDYTSLTNDNIKNIIEEFKKNIKKELLHQISTEYTCDDIVNGCDYVQYSVYESEDKKEVKTIID